MVKFHKAQTTYPHPFPAVSLAYFIRYPNPYSTHVLSTDTISHQLDAATGRLRTVRLHLKQSKLPAAVVKLLPKGILGSADGHARNYILETTVVDPHEGWMETETRNLQYTGVLTVIEQQRYSRPGGLADAPAGVEAAASLPRTGAAAGRDLVALSKGEGTDVATTVTLVSRLGQQVRAAAARGADDEPARRPGFLTSWSTAALQRTIEASGVQRTRTATVKSRQGMMVVLERIRNGGLIGALEGMRRDRELMMAGAAADASAPPAPTLDRASPDRPSNDASTLPPKSRTPHAADPASPSSPP